MPETWLSQDAYDRLQSELAELTTAGRERMAKEIEEARAHGDLRENAEYHAAKDEQGKMEARIRQLTQLLRNAHIGEPPDADVVRPGVVVTLDIMGDEEVYLVGSREDFHDRYEILSAESPLGRAIMDAHPGDTVKAEAPAGSYQVTVRSIDAL